MNPARKTQGKRKLFMLPGSDPFTALLLERQRAQVPICDERWTSSGYEPGLVRKPMTEAHKCSRIFGHRASHVCNCGSTRHTKRRATAKKLGTPRGVNADKK